MKNRGLLGWAAPASGTKGPIGQSATAGLSARRLAPWIGGLVALAASTATADDRAAPRLQGHSPQELANAANNPNAPLAQLQLRDVIAPGVPGTEGTGNLLQLLGVLPFKRGEIFPFPTTMKITVPLVTVPGPDGATAMGDIQVFD